MAMSNARVKELVEREYLIPGYPAKITHVVHTEECSYVRLELSAGVELLWVADDVDPEDLAVVEMTYGDLERTMQSMLLDTGMAHLVEQVQPWSEQE